MASVGTGYSYSPISAPSMANIGEGLSAAIGNISKNYLQQQALEKEQQRYDAQIQRQDRLDALQASQYNDQIQRQDRLDALQADRYAKSDALQASQEKRAAEQDARNVVIFNNQLADYNKKKTTGEMLQSTFAKTNSAIQGLPDSIARGVLGDYAKATDNVVKTTENDLNAARDEHLWTSDPNKFTEQEGLLDKATKDLDAYKAQQVQIQNGTFPINLTSEQRSALVRTNGYKLVQQAGADALANGADPADVANYTSALSKVYNIQSPEEVAASQATNRTNNLNEIKILSGAIDDINGGKNFRRALNPSDGSSGYPNKDHDKSNTFNMGKVADTGGNWLGFLGTTSVNTQNDAFVKLHGDYPKASREDINKAVFLTGKNNSAATEGADGKIDYHQSAEQLADAVRHNPSLHYALSNPPPSPLNPRTDTPMGGGDATSKNNTIATLTDRLDYLVKNTSTPSLTTEGSNSALIRDLIKQHLPVVPVFKPEEVTPISAKEVLYRNKLNSSDNANPKPYPFNSRPTDF